MQIKITCSASTVPPTRLSKVRYKTTDAASRYKIKNITKLTKSFTTEYVGNCRQMGKLLIPFNTDSPNTNIYNTS